MIYRDGTLMLTDPNPASWRYAWKLEDAPFRVLAYWMAHAPVRDEAEHIAMRRELATRRRA